MTARVEDEAAAWRASTRAQSVLIVDDDNGVRDLMARWLESGGYSVTTASSADEALGRLQNDQPAVALCDIRMPGHDGVWLAEKIRQRFPETAVIMATGVQDIGPADQELRQSVIDYLTKPFGRDRLREAVTRGLEFHESAWDARHWRESLEQEMAIRRARLNDAVTALDVNNRADVDGMLSMLTLTDRQAYAHGHRVAALSVALAEKVGVPSDDLEAIEHAGLLHDVGKLAIPDAILRKPAPLTAEEMALVRTHPVIGCELVARVPFLLPAARIVRDANERMDGFGYPRGLLAMDLSLEARIVCVADAYETMIHSRVFRSAISPRDALLELERCRGAQFDPLVVDAVRGIAEAEGRM